jgi:hypothetical protein
LFLDQLYLFLELDLSIHFNFFLVDSLLLPQHASPATLHLILALTLNLAFSINVTVVFLSNAHRCCLVMGVARTFHQVFFAVRTQRNTFVFNVSVAVDWVKLSRTTACALTSFQIVCYHLNFFWWKNWNWDSHYHGSVFAEQTLRPM